MEHRATYSPEDNKLRIYPASRLGKEDYDKVKLAGYGWAPKQECFFATWSPDREDCALEFAGEIDDEDKGLMERAAERAERFEEYFENRASDAAQAQRAVSAIADNIPLGQPILVGHHSEKRARRDAERIQDGMRRAVKAWETAEYWKDRAAAAVGHARYKERPDVRARRIKTIEADLRRQERSVEDTQTRIRLWNGEAKLTNKQTGEPASLRGRVLFILRNCYGSNIRFEDVESGKLSPEEAQTHVLAALQASLARPARWIAHFQNRLAYERAMLAEDGGTVADRTGPEKGGAVRCWASHGGWSYIQKVNRVSVTLLDNWGNGGKNFTRTIPFDKLAGVMTRQQVADARAEGRVMEREDKTGFTLLGAVPAARSVVIEPKNEAIEGMKASLKAGVQVVSAPQLFPTPPTPPDLAALMVERADIRSGHRVLEPSAGTGRLLDPLYNQDGTEAKYLPGGDVVAVEINEKLIWPLKRQYVDARIILGDFMEQNENLGKFDRIVMNPPFANCQDIQHIQRAFSYLKPGGRLVALCAHGPRQEAALIPWVADRRGTWERLPAGSFESEGTGVSVALIVVDAHQA